MGAFSISSGMRNFNIRVYGLWLQDGKVLVCKESVLGKEILKFPGGGLEYGEGTIDCLKREWMEELNVETQVLEHFYTTDYFQPSAFDNTQIISIYYTIRPTAALEIPVFNGRETCYFQAIDETLTAEMSLPIDKKVAAMLSQTLKQ